MALLGEEVVEEWLNRNGYFTIRGIKVDVHEIDLLAIRPLQDGRHHCRHIEVQVSTHPMSYITKVSLADRAKGIAARSARKRDPDQLARAVVEWIGTKYDLPAKVDLRNRLCPGEWTKELVVGEIRHEEEIAVLEQAGIKVLRLREIILLMDVTPRLVRAAAGADLFDLMLLGR